MRRARLAAAFALVAGLAAFSGPPAPAAADREPRATLRYTVSEARAYSYRVSLRKEVIEAARRLQPCDPATDPYECDTTRYEHQPNCPPEIAAGARGEVPEARPVPGAQPIEGGADRSEGAGPEPTMASAITLNELLALGRLGRSGDLLEAGGLASDSYVDLSGRQEPELHTESDILRGIPSVEERCLVEDETMRSYRHFLSRSAEDGPSTYHLAECFKDDCTFDRLMFSAQTVEARSIVDLREQDGRLVGRLQATFQDAAWGGGAFRVDLLDTAVTFESDGTPQGLRWSTTTTVLGAELGGRPVTVPTGRMVGNAELQVGVAAPYVHAPADGSALRIVAPGLTIASREQTAYFAGAEIDATFALGGSGAGLGSVGVGVDDTTATEGDATTAQTTGGSDASGGSLDGGGPSAGSAGGGGGGGDGGEVTAAAQGNAAQPPGERVSITRFSTGGAVVGAILAAGLLAALWILFLWLGQFPESREIYRLPPFSLVDRFYRAFLKS